MVCAFTAHMNTKTSFTVQEHLSTACGNPATAVVSQPAALLKTLRFSLENDLGMLKSIQHANWVSQTIPAKV
jgi:hypothetical protein